MNTRFKVFAFYNILQHLCDLIHVHIFVSKMPKKSHTNEYSDLYKDLQQGHLSQPNSWETRYIWCRLSSRLWMKHKGVCTMQRILLRGVGLTINFMCTWTQWHKLPYDKLYSMNWNLRSPKVYGTRSTSSKSFFTHMNITTHISCPP